MRKLLWVAACFLPAVALASGGEAASGGTDFVPRLVNFIIFVAIIYYFVAEPVKNFFTGRTAEIASKLEEVQKRLKATKQAKEDAVAEYEGAQKIAEEIIEAAKKESQLLAKKLDEQLHAELENLEKLQHEKMEVEKRQMVRKTVADVLDELFKGDAIGMDEKKFVNLIMKKVA
ncbi:F0F1 ATP synthase subunit B [Hydrogenimonas sp.]|uniref:F0F1 ATP synthase subunit B n=1 Tax=Hydrogenimonas sp. TaxID=2231112 RepID=UPI002601771C|nr:F0F1 ATP synthase subunit B [Hydrogenimonas sp.]